MHRSASGQAGERVHKLNLDVRERIDELDLEVCERIDELPFPDSVGERIDDLHLQVWKGIDDLHPDVGEGIDDFDLSREADSLIIAVGIDLRCGGRRGDAQCENQADQQTNYLFHENTSFHVELPFKNCAALNHALSAQFMSAGLFMTPASIHAAQPQFMSEGRKRPLPNQHLRSILLYLSAGSPSSDSRFTATLMTSTSVSPS